MAVARETVVATASPKKDRPVKVAYPTITFNQALSLKVTDARVTQELYDLANEWARQSQSTGYKSGLLKGEKAWHNINGVKTCYELNDVMAVAIDEIEQQLEYLKTNYDRYADMQGDDRTVAKALHDCDQFYLNMAYVCKDAWRASKMLQEFSGYSFEEQQPVARVRDSVAKAKKAGLTKEQLLALFDDIV